LESATVLRTTAALRVVCASDLVRISLITDGQKHGAAQRQRAQQRMQDIDEDHEDRHPGQVEQRHRPLAAEEVAHGVDIAAAVERFRGREAVARHVDRHPVRQRRHLGIEPRPDPDQDLGTDDIEAALEHIQPDRQRRQHHERRHAAAGQRPVVDLHHVDRARQREDVDDPRDDEQEDNDPAKVGRQLQKPLAFRRCQFLVFGHLSNPPHPLNPKDGRRLCASGRRQGPTE
jgi:hypothetical protein